MVKTMRVWGYVWIKTLLMQYSWHLRMDVSSKYTKSHFVWSTFIMQYEQCCNSGYTVSLFGKTWGEKGSRVLPKLDCPLKVAPRKWKISLPKCILVYLTPKSIKSPRQLPHPLQHHVWLLAWFSEKKNFDISIVRLALLACCNPVLLKFKRG